MGKNLGKTFLVFLSVLTLSFALHAKSDKDGHDDHHDGHDVNEFDAGATAFHHIADANVYSIGPWSIPLPCILYAPDKGWSIFSSSKFGVVGHHGDGHKAVDGYVLNGGSVNRIKPGQGFPDGEVELFSVEAFEKDAEAGHAMHPFHHKKIDGKEVSYFEYDHKEYLLDSKSTGDGGLFGGGITSYYDFSLTKNVVAMLLMTFFMIFIFIRVAKAYAARAGKAPKGLQGFIEPIFVFIQDEVAKPFLGHKWEKFLPFLMSLFFFILGLNLFGQIPFFGNANVTGNISVTVVLALFTFIVVNLNGNKNYWGHLFAMPGVPKWVLLILTPVELVGVLIKPLTLTLRLFANITAGHMVMVIFVGLIFVFGKSGQYAGLSYGTAVGSILLTMFMMAIELLVAFIQAFVFTILTASYIGAAVEEEHH